MRVHLLGPVEISSTARIDLGAPRQRSVLAALAVDAGRLVPTETVIDRIWGDDPPRQAREALYPYIARLRRLVAETAAADATPARLVRQSGGYLLDVDPDLVDLLLFRRLTSDVDQVVDLRRAFTLWRGEPLAGLHGAWVERTRSAWLQRRAEAAVAWADAELGGGEPARVVAPLTDLLAENPLMEGLAAALMRALHVTGRGSEALAVFASTRRQLTDELGADPGRDLTEAHRDVLRGSAPACSDAAGPVRLPPELADFTGRHQHLARLTALLCGTPDESAVVVVTGKAGVGKTSLAVHAGHRLAGRFPDGRIFVDLGGVGGLPVSGHVALTHVVRLLGLHDGAGAGAGPTELYRAHLAGRRILVVLDNAVTESQVRPLLPWDAGSAVVVTSQTPLAGLDAERIWLAEFDDQESLELLARTAGCERVAAEPEAARSIVEMCDRLPLGIRIAGARLSAKRHWMLADLAERLGDQQRRLDELAVGDLAIRASITLTYQSLERHEQEIFRLLGQLHGPSFPAWAPATLAGAAAADMADTLERLVDWHLIDVVGRDHANRQRYRMHDLIALFARDLPGDAGASVERQAARSEALDAWVTIFDAMEKRLVGADPAAPPRRLGGHSYPLGWVPALRSALSGEVTDTARTVLETGWSITGILVPLSFELWSQWDDWASTRESALHAARQADDRLVVPPIVRDDGVPESFTVKPGLLEPWTGTVRSLERVVRTFQRLGDLDWHAMSLLSLGNVYRAHGRFGQAADTLDRCVALFREVGNPDWQVAALLSRGSLHVVEGDLAGAVRSYEKCLKIFGDRGDPLWWAYTQRALGYAYQQHGRFAEAVAQLEPALPVLREHGDQVWEGHALLTLGLAELGCADVGRAAAHIDESLSLFRSYGDPRSEALALRARARASRGDDVERYVRASLAKFIDLENPVGTALVLADLGELLRARGDIERADHCSQLARSISG